MGYDDGKAPRYRFRNGVAQNPAAPSTNDYSPGGGARTASPPQQRLPDVQRPSARGGGLFKAPGCVRAKDAV
jgi:hypothetical protein